MTTRILPPEEWARLTGTLLESVWPTLDPCKSLVLVVEEAERIIGCVAVFQAWHADGLWIDPEHRGRTSVGRRLLAAVEESAKQVGADELAMMAVTPQAARLCERLFHGARKLDCEHFAVQMGA